MCVRVCEKCCDNMSTRTQNPMWLSKNVTRILDPDQHSCLLELTFLINIAFTDNCNNRKGCTALRYELNFESMYVLTLTRFGSSI